MRYKCQDSCMIIREVKSSGLKPGEKSLIAAWDRAHARINLVNYELNYKDYPAQEYEPPTRVYQDPEIEYEIVWVRDGLSYTDILPAEELRLEAELKQWVNENII